MKTIFLLFGFVLMMVVLLGADIRRDKETEMAKASVAEAAAEKLPCYGYTIIEFGKGINCQGDTVKLVRVRGGGQALADR